MTIRTKLTTAFLAVFLLLGSTSAVAQDPLYEYMKKRGERLQNINTYVMRIKSISFAAAAMQDNGCQAAANCLVFDVVADVPFAGRIERQMSFLEVMALTGLSMDSGTMEAMGTGFITGQMGINTAATGDADPTGGLGALAGYFSKNPEDRSPEDLESSGAPEPWLDPFSMIGAGGFMMVDAAEGMRQAEDTLDKREEIGAELAQRQKSMMEQLEPAGIEIVGGVEASRYNSTAPPASMGEVEGQEVIANNSSMWVDHERNLLIAQRFEGTFIENGQPRDFYIQTTNADFRNPPGCHDMVQPYKRIMEMGGVLNEEQMAEMKEAQKQLAEFDKQLAAMSEQERQMVENMMGSQMDTVRNMANSGTLSHTIEVEEVLCNPDLKALFSTPMSGAGVMQFSGAGLLERIQTDLKTLGYEPGNTDGVLDTMTQVAISQFEAESGMTVTGEPSQTVADALAKALGR